MTNINIDSPAVHSYLTILQGVVGRMATNSAACKTWCITLVSAIVVVIAAEGTPDCVWIALIPVILFLFLDSYYLAIERAFRDVYNDFIRKVQEETVSVENTFVVTPISGNKKVICSVARALKSFSIWAFYGMLLLMLFMARYVILDK